MITKNQKEKLNRFEKTKTKLLEKNKTILFDRSNSLRNVSPDKKSSQKWYISPDSSPKRGSPKKSMRYTNFQLNPRKTEVVSIITPNKERISVAYSQDNNRIPNDGAQDIDEVEILNQIEEEISLKESKVGKQLSALTIKRIIIVVLLLILIFPLMEAQYWFDPTRCGEFGIKMISNMLQDVLDANSINVYCQDFIQYCSNTAKIYPLIYLSTSTDSVSCNYTGADISDMRNAEKLISEVDAINITIISILDYRYNTKVNGIIGVLRTLFICVVLTVAALFITRDANELVILPIERLIKKVNRLAENPLSIKDQRLLIDHDVDRKELVVIENSIIKITTLLALGYGEAGAEIIAQQMSKTGQMEYGLKGKKLYGVFGFCDIRNFTDATEVLQQDVMVFVNNIAEIVHSIVDRYGGSANKNIGDAFLLVWKFNENLGYFIECEEKNVLPKTNKKVSDICDLAIVAFCKIIAKINRAPKILNYRQDVRLCKRIIGYKVKMVI